MKGKICIERLTKETKIVKCRSEIDIGRLNLWIWLVDLNYKCECDWLIELSDNKLFDNKLSNNKMFDYNLASKLAENRSFFKPITIEKVVIFMINIVNKY